MIRALYAGVSGLMNHAVKLDVIGNNIANVNTYGFKSARVTFAEALSQRIGTPFAPQNRFGGVNPIEIGLGSKVSSVDNNFSQGNLLSTGITTDLGIQGEGFFVVSNGDTNYFTRAGGFQIDANGNLVAQGGQYFVQGKMADISGNIPTGTSIENINLPFGQKDPAQATSEITYFCNLNADSDAKTALTEANDPFSTFASIQGGSSPAVPITIDETNNEFQIGYDDGNGMVTESINILEEGVTQANFSSIDALIEAINGSFENPSGIYNSNLQGLVLAVKVTDDIIRFQSTETGANIELTLSDGGDSLLSQLGITSGSTATGVAQASTLISDLAEVTTPLVTGDTINISGSNPDGSGVTATYVYAEGDTMQNLIDAIDSAFSGATAGLNAQGEITLTDNLPGASQSSISLSAASTVGTINLPTFSNIIAGQNYGTHSTSIDVYDSLGRAHTVEMIFNKAPEENTWNWEIKVDAGLTEPSSGDSGVVIFNSDGSLANFSGGPLVMTPEGALAMSVDLNPGTPGTFNGITQFNTPSTTIAIDQNGYTMGELQDISIEIDGIISGTYSNGVTKTLGQVAIADFNNETGLAKVGNNLFAESANSGNAVFGWAQSNFNTAINSGYLEMSNVDLTSEFTELIVAQRGFQANARVIQTADMVLAEINGLKR